MTPARLAELKGRADRFAHVRSEHVLELCHEVERLEASNAGLREAKVALAGLVHLKDVLKKSNPGAYEELKEGAWIRARAALAKDGT